MNGWQGVRPWMEMLFFSDPGSHGQGPESAILMLALAFAIGHVIGWVYMLTHRGLSYSQSFTASLVVIPVIVALIMALMTGEIVIAFGLLAVFAVVRFRNVLKDTRDTTFMLWTLVEGMSVGTQRFGLALTGCLAVSFVFLYLRMTSFGGRHRYDVILSLHVSAENQIAAALTQTLKRHCARTQLASQRHLASDLLDLSYRVLMRDPARSQELLADLEATEGIAHVSLYHREDESEM
ncbi:MAG: DUF4956 domain-containing protein [Planctomycetia bacterium]|nr:DUF4956 domain-containing protein [Planctomycetia bacterium]